MNQLFSSLISMKEKDNTSMIRWFTNILKVLPLVTFTLIPLRKIDQIRDILWNKLDFWIELKMLLKKWMISTRCNMIKTRKFQRKLIMPNFWNKGNSKTLELIQKASHLKLVVITDNLLDKYSPKLKWTMLKQGLN